MKKPITVGIIVMGSSRPESKYMDIRGIFSPEYNVEFKGLADSMTLEEIKRRFCAGEEETFIVSQAENGEDIKISENCARMLVEEKSKEFAGEGIKNIMVMCTGSFKPVDTGGVFIIPERVICGILKGLNVKRAGILVPEEPQIKDSMRQYYEFNPVIKAASPYGPMEEIERKAKEFANEEIDILLTDCMGYMEYMGRRIKELSNKNVMVPRLVVPNIMKTIIK